MKAPLAAASLLAVSFCACAIAPRKPFNPAPAPADKAAVYFYRPSEMSGRLVRPTLSVNGAELGKLANDSYAVAYLPPGQAQLRSVWPGIPGARNDDSVDVALEPGKTYYVRVRYHVREAHGLVHHSLLQFENRQGLEQVIDAEAVPAMAGMSATEGFGQAKAP